MARVYYAPDPAYDPVLGYNPALGPRKGSPPVDENGIAKPITCRANPNPTKGHGTLPKYYCSVEGNVDENGELIRYKVKGQHKGSEGNERNGEINGEFLSSRFSQAMGFYADDEWVADVTCPDCEKSLTRGFIGVKYTPFQPAAGIELKEAHGIDTDCDNDKGASLPGSLKKLAANGEPRAEIDAFKLWLAFIDHGDTKDDNHRFACLKTVKAADGTLSCAEGQAIFYVSDMGSTFGYSSDSSKKARLELWQGKDPIKIEGGKCYSTAKSIGDARVSEAGRALLAANLKRLLDEEAQNGVITRVFKASRNDERDKPASAWTAEFIRKANTIINAHCSD
ncbi:MAG: hypothetical protein JO053_10955 [Acidobacteria bacterium]|nr:hypothetical protein [Acidobacteriota bacterium]